MHDAERVLALGILLRWERRWMCNDTKGSLDPIDPARSGCHVISRCSCCTSQSRPPYSPTGTVLWWPDGRLDATIKTQNFLLTLPTHPSQSPGGVSGSDTILHFPTEEGIPHVFCNCLWICNYFQKELQTWHLVPHVSSHSHQQWLSDSVSSHPHQHLALSLFFIIAILTSSILPLFL